MKTFVLVVPGGKGATFQMEVKPKERLGFKRAAVDVARRLSVTMHAMLKTGELFDRVVGMDATNG